MFLDLFNDKFNRTLYFHVKSEPTSDSVVNVSQALPLDKCR